MKSYNGVKFRLEHHLIDVSDPEPKALPHGRQELDEHRDGGSTDDLSRMSENLEAWY